MTTDVDIASADLWLEQVLGHKVPGQLDKADAHALTAKIKSYAGVALVLLVAAHEHKVYKAMGYKTWEAYVEKEFGYSAGRSYQLLTQARIVMEISTLVSTTVDISERAARDLARNLPAAKARVIEVTEALPEDATDDDKRAAVAVVLEEARTPPPGVDPETGEIAAPLQSVACPACGGTGQVQAVAS